MTNVFSRPLPTLPHLGHLPDLQHYPAWLAAPEHITPQHYAIYTPGGIQGEAHHQQEVFLSESWDLEAGTYRLHAYHLGQWIDTEVTLKQHVLHLTEAIEIAPAHSVVLVELCNETQQWTVMIKGIAPTAEGHARFQIYKTLLQHTQRYFQPDASPHTPIASPQPTIPVQLSNGIARSLFGVQQTPSVLDVTGQRVAISAEDACNRLADLLLAHRPPYGRTLLYADGDLDLFDHFALQEVGRLLGIRNLYGSSIWASEALAAGHALIQDPVQHSLEDILSLEAPLFILNGWNGLIHHPVAFEKLAAHPTAQLWLIDSLMTESAKYLLAQHPRCEVMLIRPGSEGLLALCIARCLIEIHGFRDQADGFVDYATVAQSSIFELEPMIAELVADPQQAAQLKEQVLRLAQSLADPLKQAAHIPGNSLFQSGGTQAYCLWQNVLELVKKRHEWVTFETRNEGQQLEHFGPDRFFGGHPVTEAGCKAAAERMGLPADAYLGLLNESTRPIQDILKASQGHQRELILCIGHGLEARWIRDHDQWYEKIRSNDAILVVLDSMPGPFMLEHAALCLPLSPEISQYQLRQEGLTHWYHDWPRKQAPPETHTTTTWLYRTMQRLSEALQKSRHVQQGHPDLYQHETYFTTRFSEAHLPLKGTEICRESLWKRMQAYMHDEGVYATSWSDLLSQPRIALHPQIKTQTHGRAFQYFVPQPQDFSQPRETVLNIGSSMPNATFRSVAYAIKASTRGHAYDYGTMPRQRLLFMAPALAEQLKLQNGDTVKLQQKDDSNTSPVRCTIEISPDLKDKTLYFSHYLSQEELNTRQVMPWNRFHAQLCPYSRVPLLKKVQVECIPVNTSQEPTHA